MLRPGRAMVARTRLFFWQRQLRSQATAATHAHRQSNGFDVGGDYTRYRLRTDAGPAGAVPASAFGAAG